MYQWDKKQSCHECFFSNTFPFSWDISKYGSAGEAPWASMQDMEHAPKLNWARLKWFDNLKWQGIASEGLTHETQMAAVKWYGNALQVPNFSNLSKTVIYTAACDPLRDEGEAYARRLIEGGNEVIQKRLAGVPHPFMHMDECEFRSPLRLGQKLTFARLVTSERVH